jgi:hypothetical protein
MTFLPSLLRLIVRPPVMSTNQGRPTSSFSQLQYWVYPALCTEQLERALAHCTPQAAARQRRLASAYFGIPAARAA